MTALLHHRRAVPILLFALVWLSGAWFGSWEFNPNNSTRLFAALAIVEQGDARIDEFAHLTIDKARFGDHAYLDKAPGMTLMAVPVIGGLRVATGENTRFIDKRLDNPRLAAFMRLRLRMAAILSSGLLTALAAVALWDIGGALGGNRAAGLFAAIAYGLGSAAWGWATTLFGHASVGALLMIAFWAVWRGTRDPVPRPLLALLAGGALGWAVVIEYQAVLAGSAIALWAAARLWRHPARWRLIGGGIAGGVIALLPMTGYNLFAFGVPFKFGYEGVVGFEGMHEGLFGLTYPKPGVLAQILLGPRRGVFWVAPVLLIAPFGLYAMARGGAVRAPAIVALAVISIVLLVNAAYVYWDGGFSTGPRHSVPALPFLALGLAPIWARAKRPAVRVALLGLLALSVTINLIVAATDIFAPDDAPWPLWHPIFSPDFVNGQFRDLPSQFWGWSPWAGLALYLLLASGLGWALLRAHFWQPWRDLLVESPEQPGASPWQSPPSSPI